MKTKLTSRKFWISVAAFLGSIGTSIAGFQTNSDTVVIVGIVCATLSAAIYAGCEATVDKANVSTDNATFTTNYYNGILDETEESEE